MPRTEIEEGDTYYLVSLEVPEVPRENLRAEVIDNKELVVMGDSSDHSKFFERVFTIPQPVDASKIEATYSDHTLHLILPKAREVKTRVIPIAGERRADFLEKIRRAVGVADEEKRTA